MRKKTVHTFSGNVLNFSLPKSWAELTSEQLLYVALMLHLYGPAHVKTFVFIRFAGITVHRKNARGWLCSVSNGTFHRRIKFILYKWQIESFIHQLDYLDDPAPMPVRPEHIASYHAIDAQLHGLSFEKYLVCENLYQGYLFSHQLDCLREMIPILFVDKYPRLPGFIPRHRWRDHELIAIFIWWLSVKKYFSAIFSDFFHPVSGDAADAAPDMMEQMNIQIRALTGGDVTKEATVMRMDCWRALTELNAKAHDIQVMKNHNKLNRYE